MAGFGFKASGFPLSNVAEGGGANLRRVCGGSGRDEVVVLGLVGERIDAQLSEAFFEVSVPIVLDLFVGSFGQMRCNGRRPDRSHPNLKKLLG